MIADFFDLRFRQAALDVYETYLGLLPNFDMGGAGAINTSSHELPPCMRARAIFEESEVATDASILVYPYDEEPITAIGVQASGAEGNWTIDGAKSTVKGVRKLVEEVDIPLTEASVKWRFYERDDLIAALEYVENVVAQAD